MSLINDVLRDLERRGHPDSPRSLPARNPAAGPARRWLWWVVGAVLTGALLHWTLGGTDTAETPAGPALAADKASPPERDRESAPQMLQPLPRVAASDDAQGAEMDAGTDQPGEPRPAAGSEGTPPRPEAEAAPAAPQSAAPAQERVPPRDREAPKPIATADNATADRATTESADAADEPAIVIRRSGSGEAGRDRFEGARRALALGNDGLAASRLDEVLDADPGHVEARLLLARVHIRAGRPRTAARVLEAGLDTESAPGEGEPRLAQLWGRLLMEQGRLASARSVLADHAPPLDGYPEYHLLMAAAHRQAGDHESAVAAYRALTDAHPGLGAAWVGLGVSLETLDRPSEARDAYEKALQGDDRRAAGFARQRLAVMPRADESEKD